MNNFFDPIFFTNPAFLAILLAILIGTVASVFGVIFFTRVLVRKHASYGIVSVTTFLIAAVSYPFAWYLGYIVGGTFGGGLASMIPIHLFSDSMQISFGIGVGIFTCIMLISMSATLCGFVLGKILEKMWAVYSSLLKHP